MAKSMRKTFTGLLSTTLICILAGCGSSAPVSPGGGAAAGGTATASNAAPTVRRQPGSWQMLRYTMAFDATGVTGGMAEMVKAGQASIGHKDSSGPLCLSAEQAAKDTLQLRLQEAMQLGPEWKVLRSAVAADGKVDFAAAMDDPQQGKGEITITGAITPTTTDLLVTSDAHEPAPGKGHVQTRMKTENTRVGDCTPGEDPLG